ncbi:MAG: ChrR family anti-sigma-E factor [Pseudomonadota bacterium]
MPTHLPSTEMLADYSSGAASPGATLLIAAHLMHSSESRRQVAEMERIGGALLSDEEPIAMSASALSDVLNVIDAEPEIEADPIELDSGPLPRPVIEAVGMDFDDIQWKFRLPGVSEYELEGFGSEKVSLLRARPGVAIPQHTHHGREATLVLAGALQDGDSVYRAGDLSLNDEDDDHRPQIIGDETCYCLIVMDGNLHFTGTFSRALNFLGD